MFVPFKIKVGTAAVALALASGSFTAHAILEREGPVTGNTAHGFFPAWYQDRTGITLEFCAPEDAELDGTWCLLGTPEVPSPPEVFPANFFDEHFYFAASAGMDTRTGGRALLVLAEEAAFASGAPQAGQQIVFSRIRVRLASAPVTGTYRFIHPYGEESIFANAGERIFFTEDIGIDCAPGKFNCSTTSRLGPFLLPSAAPGGPEMRALTAEFPQPDTNPANFGGAFTPTPHPGNGKAYLADPARIGPVTGSPLGTFVDSTGAVRNHNIFRIEGPAGSGLGINPNTGAVVDWIETTGFSLMGRLYNGEIPGRVAVQRASYARNATDGIKIDVMADGQPTMSSRMPGQAAAPSVPPALSFYNAPCLITTDALGVTHYSQPSGAGVVETQMLSIGKQYWGQTRPVNIPLSVCVKQSNAVAAGGANVPTYLPQRVTDEVTISAANYDQVAKTLTVRAASSDAVNPPALTLNYPTFTSTALAGGAITVPLVEVPPHKVTVVSDANVSAGGSNQLDVRTPLGAAPPVAPSGVAAALGTTRAINVSWTDNSTDETSFEISRATAAAGPYTLVGNTSGDASTGLRSFVDTNGPPAANTTYFYRVVALRNGVSSAVVQSAGLTTPQAAQAATNLVPTVVSASQVNLTWTNNLRETSFEVLRRTGAAGAFVSIATLPANSTSFSDTAVVGGTTYFYRVDALNWVGSTASAISAAVTPVDIVLLAPTNVAASQSTTPAISWIDQSTGETAYRVRRIPYTVTANGSVTANPPANASTTVLAVAGTGGTRSFTDNNAAGNTTYKYDVAALNGTTAGPLALSNFTLTGTMPAGPTQGTPVRSAVGAAVSTITLNWTTSGAARVGGYEIQRCSFVAPATTCANFAKLNGTAVNTAGTVDGRATASFVDNQVVIGTTYRYRIRTVGGAGTGFVGGFGGTVNATAR